MSEIYRLKIDGANYIDLVSITYLKQSISNILNILRSHILNIDDAHKLIDPSHPEALENQINNNILNTDDDNDIITIDISKYANKKIDANDIIQSSSARLLSDSQITLFRQKPSLFEVQNIIKDSENTINKKIQEFFTQLLNDEELLSKIKSLLELIKDNSKLDELLDLLIDNISKEEFNEHIKSNKHVNTIDRKALNLLIDLLQNGILDRLKENTITHSLLADNAKTIDGYKVNELQNKHLEDVIYGLINSYKSNEVDMLISNIDDIDISDKCIISIKPGDYECHHVIWNKHKYDITVNGTSRTVFYTNNDDGHIKLSNITINNITFDSLYIDIEENVKFFNCIFKNCKFVLKNTNLLLIKFCTFMNSSFNISSIRNINISENYYKNTLIPKLLGSSFIIENNLKI